MPVPVMVATRKRVGSMLGELYVQGIVNRGVYDLSVEAENGQMSLHLVILNLNSLLQVSQVGFNVICVGMDDEGRKRAKMHHTHACQE